MMAQPRTTGPALQGFCAGMLGLMLAGCSQGALTAPPSAGIATPAEFSVDAAPISADVTDYWLMLDDPLLTQFVEQAAANNLEIEQAAARVAQARAGLRAQQADFLPSVTGTAGVRRDVGDFADDDFVLSAGVDASWEADLFGRITNSVAASRADLAAAGYSLADIQRLVIGQVAQLTIAARSSSVQLAIARDTLRNQDENLQLARWRNQAGLVSSLDVERARFQRAQTAATIPALESDLAANANAISTLIGETPGRVRSLLTSEAAIPAPPDIVGLGIPAETLRRRPDVRAAEARLMADSARTDVARAQLLPLVRLTGNIGTSGVGIGDVFDIITGNLFAGVSQLIFDGGRTRAQIDNAAAIANSSLAAWRLEILSSLEEVESNYAAFEAARRRIALFTEAREAANNTAILARSQYQAGLIDFQILLDAENQLLSARNALAGAQAARAQSFVSLTQALGGGWDADAAELETDTATGELIANEGPSE